MSIDGIPLCSHDFDGLEGKDITVKFPAREITGKLKKRFFSNEYRFVFNETPGNIHGQVIINPIYPIDAVPQNARNYQILTLLDNKYKLSPQ